MAPHAPQRSSRPGAAGALLGQAIRSRALSRAVWVGEVTMPESWRIEGESAWPDQAAGAGYAVALPRWSFRLFAGPFIRAGSRAEAATIVRTAARAAGILPPERPTTVTLTPEGRR